MLAPGAVRARIAEPTEPIVVSDGSYRWRIGGEALRRIVDEVRREEPPYGVGRERVRARVVGAAAAAGRGAARRLARRAVAAPDGARRGRCVAFLDAAWPAVTPEELVLDLLTDPPAWPRRRRACSPPTSRRAAAGRSRPGRRRRPAGRAADARADRRGGRADRAAAELRPRGRRRGAGPVPDAVPGDRPAQRARLDHAARRPGPGHRAVGGPRLGGDARATWASRTRRSCR